MRKQHVGMVLIGILIAGAFAAVARCKMRPTTREVRELERDVKEAQTRHKALLDHLGVTAIPTAGIAACDELVIEITARPHCRDAAATASYDGELTAATKVLTDTANGAAACAATLESLTAARERLGCE